jgi:hypothetical protein
MRGTEQQDKSKAAEEVLLTLAYKITVISNRKSLVIALLCGTVTVV